MSIIIEKIGELFKKYVRLPNFKISTAILTATAFLVLIARWKKNSFIYFPDIGFGKSCSTNPIALQNPANLGMKYEEVKINVQNNVLLQGWHIIHQNPKRFIVYFHENAGNIGLRMNFLKMASEKWQADILIVAYRGFSDSTDCPINEEGLKRDAEGILAKGLQIARGDVFKPLPVAVYGRSLGGAVAIYVCGLPRFQMEIDCLMLENTFTTIYEVSYMLLFKGLAPLLYLILGDTWNSRSRVKYLTAPILFIKCAKDSLVPKILMDKLQSTAVKERIISAEYLIQNGEHNNGYLVEGDNFFRQTREFMERHEKNHNLIETSSSLLGRDS